MNSIAVATLISNGDALESRYEIMSADIQYAVNKIASAKVTLLDAGRENNAASFVEMSDASVFAPGSDVTLTLSYLEQSASENTTSFSGILITHRVRVTAKGVYLTLNIKDPVIGMSKVRRNAVFSKETTDNTIIKSIIDDYDKVNAGSIDCADYTHTPNMIQHYCRDWDFILSRTVANGKWLLNMDGEIEIQEPEISETAVMTLDFSSNEYYSIDLQANIQEQIPSVNIDAWNISTLKSDGVSQEQESTVGLGTLNPADMASALGIPDVKLQSFVDLNQDEASAWAQSSLTKSLLSMYQGTITLPGTSLLKLGDTIAIKGLSNLFNGNTIITGIRHQLGREGWLTYLQIGLCHGWLKHICDMEDTAAAALVPAISGLQVGVVKEYEEDSEGKYRIPVQVSAFATADEDTTNVVFARLGIFSAGDQRGALFQPQAGDEVILGFFNNDPRQAVILGAMHGPKNLPPSDAVDSDKSYKYQGIVIDENMQLRFDTSVSPTEVELRSSQDNKVLLTGGDDGEFNIATKSTVQLNPEKSFKLTTQESDVDSSTVNISGKVNVK